MIESDKILWQDNTLDELKALLGDDIIIEFEDDETFTKLGFPWPITVTDVSVTTDSAGRSWATMIIEFAAVEASNSYEVRFSIYETAAPSTILMLSSWQPVSEHRTDGADTKGSGWVMAENIGTDLSTGLIVWQNTNDPTDFIETSTIPIMARTISLDGLGDMSAEYNIADITLSDSVYPQPDHLCSIRLADGRALFVMNNYSTSPTFRATTLLLVDTDGSYLDHETYETYAAYSDSIHESADGVVFIPMSSPSNMVASFTLTSNVITKVTELALPANPVATMALMSNSDTLFMLGYFSGVGGTRYYACSRSGATISGWGAAQVISSPAEYGSTTVEVWSRGRIVPIVSATNKYALLGFIGGAYNGIAVIECDTGASGTTLTVSAATILKAPDNSYMSTITSFDLSTNDMTFKKIDSGNYVVVYIRNRTTGGYDEQDAHIIHNISYPFGATAGQWSDRIYSLYPSTPYSFPAFTESVQSYRHFAMVGLTGVTVVEQGDNTGTSRDFGYTVWSPYSSIA